MSPSKAAGCCAGRSPRRSSGCQKNSAIGSAKAAIIARRGKQAKNIAKVAAARKLLTLVYYGLRDHQIRALAKPAAPTAPPPAAAA
jgi:hypothetical protein